MEAGKYQLPVTDLSGKRIYDQALDHIGGIISQSIQLPLTITLGIYLLTIKGNELNMVKQFVVKQSFDVSLGLFPIFY